VAGRNEKPPEVKATWYIDNKQVAEGIDAFVTVPRAGKHRARLAVAIGRQCASAEVTFQSVRIPLESELEEKH
jgi:hypothetical protein